MLDRFGYSKWVYGVSYGPIWAAVRFGVTGTAPPSLSHV